MLCHRNDTATKKYTSFGFIAPVVLTLMFGYIGVAPGHVHGYPWYMYVVLHSELLLERRITVSVKLFPRKPEKAREAPPVSLPN